MNQNNNAEENASIFIIENGKIIWNPNYPFENYGK